MTKASEEFKSQYQSKTYPAALLERYTVIECLSSSANGETLLVTRHGENQYLVAKLVERAESDNESALLGQLSHPALPELIETFADGDTRILVRSFVAGKTLDVVIAERAMSEAEVVNIGAQLCDVLAYLHTQNPPVIHRDVKPQNVILDADGKVTLIDLGIARTYKPQAAKDTVFSGTSDFAPPEQYGFSQTDARADIYSLGVLLKFLLTRGDPDAEIYNRRLRRIVKKCTAFAPNARYRSAEAVKRALLRADGRRARRFAAVAVAVMAALVGLAVGRYALPYRDGASSIAFHEPAVERAVRLVLDKPAGALTAEDLSRVHELHISGSEAYSDRESFSQAWVNGIEHINAPREGLYTLADFALLPNLETLDIVFGDYSDLSGLSACSQLNDLHLLKNGSLTDIDAIAGLPNLTFLEMIDCSSVESIDAMTALPRLETVIMVGNAGIYDPSPLAKLGDMDIICIEGIRASYQFMGNRRIKNLSLADCDIETLQPLQTVTGLEELALYRTPLASLEGIGVHQELRLLNISYTAVTDLSPLLGLPNLRELVLSEDMQVDVSVLAGLDGLTVRCE